MATPYSELARTSNEQNSGAASGSISLSSSRPSHRRPARQQVGRRADLIRIFLANRPRLVRQMLRRAIQRMPDMRVVGEATRPDSVQRAMQTIEFDWLVVALTAEGAFPNDYLEIAEQTPDLQLLGISLDGTCLALRSGGGDGIQQLENVTLKRLMGLFQQTLSH